ncbi:MAG: cyclase family protein [Methanomicrobiales archaeon]|nr:cyclase family protein [Methanomicrobiales archaeon]
MRLLLSYPLTCASPLYPGTPPCRVEENRSLERGDSATTSILSLSSHAGTHLDFPRHFCAGGADLMDLISSEEIIAPVYCRDIPVDGGGPVTPSMVAEAVEGAGDARGILIRTGSFRDRSRHPDRYAREHPWIHPDVPGVLRRLCPHLRLFGTDTISVATPLHREAGRAAHRGFLCGSPAIMLLEDANLADVRLTEGAWRLWCYPLVYERLDGIPVLVLGEPIE